MDLGLLIMCCRISCSVFHFNWLLIHHWTMMHIASNLTRSNSMQRLSEWLSWTSLSTSSVLFSAIVIWWKNFCLLFLISHAIHSRFPVCPRSELRMRNHCGSCAFWSGNYAQHSGIAEQKPVSDVQRQPGALGQLQLGPRGLPRPCEWKTWLSHEYMEM